MAHKTKATPEEKVMLIKKHLAGEISAAEACKIARIKDASFRSWIVTATIGRPKPDGIRRPKFAGEDGQFNCAVELAIFLT